MDLKFKENNMKFTLIGEDYIGGDKTTVEFTAADINVILVKMKEFLLGCGYMCRPGNLDFVENKETDEGYSYNYYDNMSYSSGGVELCSETLTFSDDNMSLSNLNSFDFITIGFPDLIENRNKL